MLEQSLRQSHKQYQGPLSKSYLFYLENMTVEFSKTKALQNIQLAINEGEIVFITGVSGAGKTTLLKVLAGEINPTGGRISGKAMTSKKFTSMIFQDLRLIDDQSIENNLWFAYDSSIYKNRNEFYEDLLQLAKILKIDDKMGNLIRDCNRGLQQKVAILRSLMTRPDIILADEPTSALDKENANSLYDIFSFYNSKRKVTIIWASHNRDLVKTFSGRIIHLQNGKLVHSGHACFI